MVSVVTDPESDERGWRERTGPRTVHLPSRCEGPSVAFAQRAGARRVRYFLSETIPGRFQLAGKSGLVASRISTIARRSSTESRAYPGV
jgi:hypothetical protein